MIYTGIGSRDVTSKEYNILRDIASKLGEQGYTLRSGGAGGSDLAFEEGCALSEGKAEIFIPWNKFGTKIVNPNSKRYVPSKEKFGDARNYLIEEGIIPWFDKMKQGAQKLHARNYYQLKGFGTNSDFMVYCADDDKDGVPKGGTRTAILLGRSFNIPTYNIRDESQMYLFFKYIDVNK